MDMCKERPIITLIIGILCSMAGTALGGSILGSSLFHDVPAGSPYDSAIGDVVNAKILDGFGDGTFHPDEYVTRGQLALALDALLLSREKNSSQRSGRRTPRETTKRKKSAPVSSLEEGTGTFHFATAGFSIIEKAKSITVSIERSNGNTGTASIEYAVEDETTSKGTDYVDTTGTLTFGNGENAKILQIPLKDDSASEGTERLRITLTHPSGASLGSPATMVVSLLDDESVNRASSTSSSSASTSSTPPTTGGGTTISFSAEQYSTGEHSGNATVTVIRSGTVSGQSTVEYETTNGTALAGIEYTATKGTLTFTTGETQKTFQIPITNNTTIEGMKTVNLALKNPTGSLLGSSTSATLSVIDDEIEQYGIGSLKFQKSAERTSEGAGGVSLTLLRIGGSKGSVSINYTTKSGLALAGSDYTETNGTMTFLEGEAAKSIRIPIAKDTNTLEEEEAFSVSLSNASGGASIIDPTTVTITIAP